MEPINTTVIIEKVTYYVTISHIEQNFKDDSSRYHIDYKVEPDPKSSYHYEMIRNRLNNLCNITYRNYLLRRESNNENE